jgi:hypothetical protein
MSGKLTAIIAADRKGWVCFGIAAGLLLLATVGWSLGMHHFKLWTQKYPVPWPERVRVDEETFRNVSLPERIGPYRIVGDGFFERNDAGEPLYDKVPDGEIIFRDDLLESLRVGTTLDSQRYDERMSNWYVARIYEDTREPMNSPFKFWQMDVTFYTGSEVTVPHVPDICAQAGGATLDGREVLHFPVAGAPAPWDTGTPLAALYYLKDGRQFVQYYVFCLNGLPQANRDAVRLALTDLSLRYVYYAKIQFFPRGTVTNREEVNDRARDFLRQVLPIVLQEMPSRRTMQKYNEG